MDIQLMIYQSDGKKLRETSYCTICFTAAAAAVGGGVLDGLAASLLRRRRTPDDLDVNL